MLRDFQPTGQTALQELILAGRVDRWGEAFDPDGNPDLNDFVANYLDLTRDQAVLRADP